MSIIPPVVFDNNFNKQWGILYLFWKQANQEVKARSVKETKKCLLSDIEENTVIWIQFKLTKIIYFEYILNQNDLKNKKAQCCVCQLNR